MAMEYVMAEAHMGITFNTHFTSSTCWMLQSFHGSDGDPSGLISSSGVTIAALLRNLIQISSD